MGKYLCILFCFLIASLSPLHAQQPVTDGFLPTEDGTRLAYKVIGNGSEVLVVPGGYSALVTDFSPLAKGRRLVLYDQRDRGHSDPVKDLSHIGMAYEVRDLETVRRHFHIEKMSLLGCSYLGGVVALYALEHPEHVERLILVDPIPPRRELYAQAEQILNGRLDSVAVDRLENMRKSGEGKVDPVQVCREADKVYNPAYFGDPSAAATYHTACELESEQPDNADKNWAALDRSLGDWDWRPRLKGVKSPVFIVYGAKDWIPESAAQEWVERLPTARLLKLAGVGHISWFERSDLVFTAADSFLRGTSPNGAEEAQHDAAVSLTKVVTYGSLEQEIVAHEKQVWDLSARADLEPYAKLISDDALAVYSDGYASKKDVIDAVRGMTDMHYSMEDIKVIPVSDTSGLMVYRVTQDWKEGGKQLARQYYVSSLWTKDNGKWLSRFWQETDATLSDDALSAQALAKEREILETVKHNDWTAFSALLADDAVAIDEDGIHGKKELLDEIQSAGTNFSDYKMENVKVIPQSNGAVVAYRETLVGTERGKPFTWHIYTHSHWERRGDKWLMTMFQESMAKE